ncbi:hypothetical protein KYK30_31375 [Shinella yambaruensis]|uniref:Uncharacterized protein n=2 Tax=Bacteria TaxID=2 RepID=A0ABQ5ZSS4_9HYPH|nr:hypothetical protein [Shinella yambaruensis]MCJ8029977.1 hypothetical protein [Shinella yambaruensis]MCU7984225.1 hypothetical protein [Shinella yambaruensis]GLR55176.1 hypothetical protein GCM10007923_63980 [Shinella yambaruensis]
MDIRTILDSRLSCVHNVRLMGISKDHHGGEILTIKWSQGTQDLATGFPHRNYSNVQARINSVGYMAMAGRPGKFYFAPYYDQSLMRFPDLDGVDHQDGRSYWGWICAERPRGFHAPSGVIPGERGRFIPDETIPVTIAVPSEFVRLCRAYKMNPEQMLRGFIGDAAGLHNLLSCPRADGYGSNGSDERQFASDWIDRAYGHSRIDLEAREAAEQKQRLRDAELEDFAGILDDFIDAGGDAGSFVQAVASLAETMAPDQPGGSH